MIVCVPVNIPPCRTTFAPSYAFAFEGPAKGNWMCWRASTPQPHQSYPPWIYHRHPMILPTMTRRNFGNQSPLPHRLEKSDLKIHRQQRDCSTNNGMTTN